MMTIRNRLKLIGLIPITLLILLSSYFFVTSYINFEKANALKSTLKNNVLLNKILLNVGKERDLTSLYLGSDKKPYNFNGCAYVDNIEEARKKAFEFIQETLKKRIESKEIDLDNLEDEEEEALKFFGLNHQ